MIKDVESAIDFFFVLLSRQSVLGLLVIFNFEEPGIFCLIVDESGVFLDLVIDGDDFSSKRGVHISCQFDALDHKRALSDFYFLADAWELNMNDFSELLLSIVGDADSCCTFSFDKLHPLMSFGVGLG
jgi:hypothetical protein